MLKEEEINPFKHSNNQSYESTSNQAQVTDHKMNRTEKFSLFAILVFVVLTLGISTSTFGASLTQLSKNINVDITELSYGILLRFFVSCFGSLAASFWLDRYNRQLQFALHNILFGIIFIIFPLCTSFILYLFVSAAQGFISPFLGTIPSVWIIELFGESSKTYLQIYHFFYPIGQLFGSVVTAPFLKNDTSNLNLTEPSFNTNYDKFGFVENLFETTKHSKIWVPFLIVSIFNLFGGFITIWAYLIKPYRRPKKEIIENSQLMIYEDAKKNLSKSYSIIFVGLICVITGIQLANEINSITYLPAYLEKGGLQLDSQASAYAQAVLSSATTVGRFVNIFLTLKIGIQSMLFINFVSMISGNIIIMTIGNFSLNGIYFGTILLGYGFSNAFPMIISLTEERITINNKIMAYMNFSSGFIIGITSVLLGSFLDSNTKYYIYLNLGVTIFSFLTYVVLVILEHSRLSKK